MKKHSFALVLVIVLLFACLPVKTNNASAYPGECTHPSSTLKVMKAATCVSDGYKAYVCNKCNQVVPNAPTVRIPKTNVHSWQYQGTFQPSCTAAGYHLFRCSVCGTTKKETIKKLDHNYALSVDKNGTHFSNVHYRCTRCNNEKVKSVYCDRSSVGVPVALYYLRGTDVDEFVKEIQWYREKAGAYWDQFNADNSVTNFGSNWLLNELSRMTRKLGTSSVSSICHYGYYHLSEFRQATMLVIKLDRRFDTGAVSFEICIGTSECNNSVIPSAGSWNLLR